MSKPASLQEKKQALARSLVDQLPSFRQQRMFGDKVLKFADALLEEVAKAADEETLACRHCQTGSDDKSQACNWAMASATADIIAAHIRAAKETP